MSQAGPQAPLHPLLCPRTNGKDERFIQTALREWAYAYTYQNSTERSQQLRRWLHTYNWHRPHASLNQLPPSAAPASTGITC
jgi:transposase InsO family protein